METNRLLTYLASVIGENFNLTLEDVEKEQDDANKEIIYGLICLHGDLKFYKEKSDLLLSNFKSTLFNSTLISITNSNGIIKDVNSKFTELSGFSKNELIGQPLSMLDNINDQKSTLKELKNKITNGKSWSGELCHTNKKGKTFWLNTNVFPIKNTENNIHEYWSISENITHKKQIEIELKSKNEELKQFAYILSHDLKAPLRAMATLANFIEEDLDENNLDEVRAHIVKLKSRASRMESLIHGIMDFTKVGMAKSEKSEINLNNLVKEIFNDLNFGKNNELLIKQELPTISGVYILFEQLYSNIISNAIKYNDKENGKIIIDVIELEKSYEFSITDNGPGIKKEYHNQVFEIFKTLNARDRLESTGIGLSIVNKVINLLHGSIRIESEYGNGTSFIFKIPKS